MVNYTKQDKVTLLRDFLNVVGTTPTGVEVEVTQDADNGLRFYAFAKDSVLPEHVTNTGSVTEVTLQHGGEQLGEDRVGIPLDRTCQTDSAVVTWRAATAPAGTWTLTLKKKAAGSRSYTTAATMPVNVNNG